MDQARRGVQRRHAKQDGWGLVYILLATSVVVMVSATLLFVLER